MHGKKDSLLDGYHAVIRPCVPSPQSHGTLGWHSLPKIPLTVGQGQVLEPPEQPNFHANKVTILRDWDTYTDGRTHVSDGETEAGWGAVARSPGWKTECLFGTVVTTEAQLAYAGARLQTYNTAELTSVIEAPSFLPAGPVTRGSQACIFCDSKHAAGMYGNDTDMRECAVGLDQSATLAPTPSEAACHHAAYQQSWAKRRERMCGPCCISRCIWCHLELEHQHTWSP